MSLVLTTQRGFPVKKEDVKQMVVYVCALFLCFCLVGLILFPDILLIVVYFPLVHLLGWMGGIGDRLFLFFAYFVLMLRRFGWWFPFVAARSHHGFVDVRRLSLLWRWCCWHLGNICAMYARANI